MSISKKFNNDCKTSRALIMYFSLSISGQAHEGDSRAIAESLTIVIAKDNDVSFPSSVLLLTMNFAIICQSNLRQASRERSCEGHQK